MSGLDLSGREPILRGGSRGPAAVPGAPEKSLLLKAVLREDKVAMPPTGPIPEAEVQALRDWIRKGMEWTAPAAPVARNWWSFTKPVKSSGPASIDPFIQLKLAEQKLAASSEASRGTLVRRLYLDLTGLRPTADEAARFIRDPDPDAYAKLVDKLLESQRYGEKWGRHWLDLVRYSDTAGFELDSYIADAWGYRDYVIASFNNDKPYDRFIREQIAGDEFFPEDPASVTGTGLYCVGPNRDLYPDQSDINREETLTDFVDTTAGVFLGLTFGCARCHDHKFDPFTQRDYYKLRAVFAPAVKTKIALDRLTSLSYDVQGNIREIKLREIGEQIGSIERRCREEVLKGRRPKAQEVRACLSPAELDRMRSVEAWLVSLYTSYRAKPFACGLNDVGDYAPRTLVPVKGQMEGDPVNPGLPAVFGGAEFRDRLGPRETTGPIPLGPTTERRRALADWIASRDNPLTARVFVNRVWQYHFGRGLVATPSDFGMRGRAPSHPELLDWLAAEFMANGWKPKWLHRLILNSAAYRRASTASSQALARDPENIWLARFTRRRLNAEELRDTVLQASGALNLKMGGRPVVPPLTGEEGFNMIGRAADMWVVTHDAREHTRRSIYLFQKRTFRLPMMEVFDAPESMLTCARRDVSTTSPQSLTLLNGSFAVEQSRKLAARLAAEHPEEAALIRAMWRSTLSRDPSTREEAMARDFLAAQSAQTGSREKAAAELARGLFNVNEFLYAD